MLNDLAIYVSLTISLLLLAFSVRLALSLYNFA
jgi:hypothetical protein